MNKFFTRYSHRLLVAGIVVSFVLLSVGSAMRESLTYDEIVHSEEGINHLQKHTFTADTYNPPLIRELQMLPTALRIVTERLFANRLITVLLGALLLIIVYFTARKYFGKEAGLFALVFLAFDPNMLAHSHYVTMDAGTALFFFVAYSALIYFWEKPTFGRTIMFGISLGLALASRVMLLPYMGAAVLLLGFVKKWKLPSLRYVGAALLISLLVIWATYFFRWEVVIAKGGSPGRVSQQLKYFAAAQKLPVLESGLNILENRPLPLGNYLATMKNSFLRGMQNTAKPGWYELVVNVLLKTPIPLLFFTLLGLWKLKKSLFIVPVIGILAVAVGTGMESRVRYVLAIYPFLAIIAAIGIRMVWRSQIPLRGRKYGKLGVGVLLLWYIVGTLASFPHFVSYANELVPRNERYLYFTDSNIDWGQSLGDLSAYIAQVKPSHVSFSYFGRDNGNDYGLVSNRQWGSYKFEEICAFHEIALPYDGERLVAISVSNWYGCGYSKEERFSKEKIVHAVADSILIFTN